MALPTSPTVSRIELAKTLRLLRGRVKLTLEQAAVALETSAATISRIETGARVPRARDVRDLCALYGVTDPDRVAGLVALVADAKESGWWESYTEVDDDYATLIGLETAATVIDQFEGSVIPGLLQTADYMEAYLRQAVNPGRSRPFSDNDIVKRNEIRSRRQETLLKTPQRTYSVILEENTLRRPVGGPSVMRDQVSHILEVGRHSDVEVSMIPMDRGAHPGMAGGFVVLTLPHSQVSDVVYVDSLVGQIFLESPEEIARHRQVFWAIKQKSLHGAECREALQKIMGEHERRL